MRHCRPDGIADQHLGLSNCSTVRFSSSKWQKTNVTIRVVPEAQAAQHAIDIKSTHRLCHNPHKTDQPCIYDIFQAQIDRWTDAFCVVDHLQCSSFILLPGSMHSSVVCRQQSVHKAAVIPVLKNDESSCDIRGWWAQSVQSRKPSSPHPKRGSGPDPSQSLWSQTSTSNCMPHLSIHVSHVHAIVKHC